MSRLLACLAFVGLVGPAAACINDIELPGHEREFRSRYRGPSNPPAAPSTDTTDPPARRLLFGSGTVLLAGAAALALTGRPRT
jgi:hypothetical protein